MDQRQEYCRNNEPAKYICLLRDGDLQKPQWKKLLHYMKEKVQLNRNFTQILNIRIGALRLCMNSVACSICSITCRRLPSNTSTRPLRFWTNLIRHAVIPKKREDTLIMTTSILFSLNQIYTHVCSDCLLETAVSVYM